MMKKKKKTHFPLHPVPRVPGTIRTPGGPRAWHRTGPGARCPVLGAEPAAGPRGLLVVGGFWGGGCPACPHPACIPAPSCTRREARWEPGRLLRSAALNHAGASLRFPPALTSRAQSRQAPTRQRPAPRVAASPPFFFCYIPPPPTPFPFPAVPAPNPAVHAAPTLHPQLLCTSPCAVHPPCTLRTRRAPRAPSSRPCSSSCTLCTQQPARQRGVAAPLVSPS